MRAGRHLLGAVFLAALVSGCSRGEEFVVAYADPTPAPSGFTICHGYGCQYKAEVKMTPAGWQKVRAAFGTRPATPEAERDAAARAIAVLEKKVGSATGTDVDEPGAALIAKNRFQQDCIDETVNTTTYLRMLHADGLLRFHDIGEAAWRGKFIDRWPHNTAVLVERDSGSAYAMDSWFHANGVRPEIVPLDKWKAGWSPASHTG